MLIVTAGYGIFRQHYGPFPDEESREQWIQTTKAQDPVRGVVVDVTELPVTVNERVSDRHERTFPPPAL